MNAERREKFEVIKTHIEELRDAEQDALDNLPENMAESDKAGEMQTNVEAFENALSELENVV